jgi:hypothetical protein
MPATDGMALGDRIDYSTVNVTVMAQTVGGPVGNLVLLFGLVLPWLGVLVVTGGIGYGVIRLMRGRRS